jgi:hypothetical protein
MALATFFQTVCSHWQALTQRVWPETAEHRTQAEIARLTAELNHRSREMVLRQCRIERARDCLAKKERRVEELSAQVRNVSEPERTWELALLLDRLYQSIQRAQQRLQYRLEAYDRKRRQFERRKQLLRVLTGSQVVLTEQEIES